MSTRAMFDLDGVTALVTGAGMGGLGHHSAVALGELGARVWVSDHETRSADLDATVSDLRARGIEAEAHTADICSEDDVDALFDRIDEEAGGAGVLAHHAGINLRETAWDTTPEAWRRVLDVNVTGTWLAARRAARSMAAQRRGKIITLGSVYTSIVGPIPESAYYASKGAVANLTRGLAMEFASVGVTANCVAPGTFYPTLMTSALGQDDSRLQSMAQRTMIGRLGDPEKDLRGVIGFLACPASDYMTGQVVHVDGGWSAW